jgi:hypothetical protein
MTLQAIRAFFEVPLFTAYSALTPPVPVYIDNQTITTPDATTDFVVLFLTFGLITEPTITNSLSWHRGSLVVECFSPKGVGPGRGQTLIETAITTLSAMNATQGTAINNVRGSIGPITGPAFFALEGRPHYLTRLSVPVQARYTA